MNVLGEVLIDLLNMADTCVEEKACMDVLIIAEQQERERERRKFQAFIVFLVDIHLSL